MHGLRAHCFKKFLYTMMHECMLAVMFRFKHYRFKGFNSPEGNSFYSNKRGFGNVKRIGSLF